MIGLGGDSEEQAKIAIALPKKRERKRAGVLYLLWGVRLRIVGVNLELGGR